MAVCRCPIGSYREGSAVSEAWVFVQAFELCLQRARHAVPPQGQARAAHVIVRALYRLPEKTSGKSNGGGKKLVPVDSGGNTLAPVVRLDAHDFGVASDVHIAGHCDLARQGENKLNTAARIVIRVNQKIEPAETDVPCLSLPLGAVCSARPDSQRQRHGKSP